MISSYVRLTRHWKLIISGYVDQALEVDHLWVVYSLLLVVVDAWYDLGSYVTGTALMSMTWDSHQSKRGLTISKRVGWLGIYILYTCHLQPELAQSHNFVGFALNLPRSGFKSTSPPVQELLRRADSYSLLYLSPLFCRPTNGRHSKKVIKLGVTD